MEVILMEGIKRLGALGDKVNVKAGFARNFLVPQGMAVLANEANLAKFELRRAELERIESEKHVAAQVRADALNGLRLTLPVAVSEEGKLYGSVGTHELETAILAKGIEIHRSEISLPDGVIRFVGEYEITIILHHGIHATVHLEVVSDRAV
jgi:large subunit ribosomal protein L9